MSSAEWIIVSFVLISHINFWALYWFYWQERKRRIAAEQHALMIQRYRKQGAE